MPDKVCILCSQQSDMHDICPKCRPAFKAKWAQALDSRRIAGACACQLWAFVDSDPTATAAEKRHIYRIIEVVSGPIDLCSCPRRMAEYEQLKREREAERERQRLELEEQGRAIQRGIEKRWRSDLKEMRRRMRRLLKPSESSNGLPAHHVLVPRATVTLDDYDRRRWRSTQVVNRFDPYIEREDRDFWAHYQTPDKLRYHAGAWPTLDEQREALGYFGMN